jgi:hypothetical protein
VAAPHAAAIPVPSPACKSSRREIRIASPFGA